MGRSGNSHELRACALRNCTPIWRGQIMRNVALLGLVVFAGCLPGDDRTALVVYSPHGTDLLTEFEARFEQLHSDVDVQWLDMGSQSVLDRLRSERRNPQADVWWGAPAALFETAAAEGLLEQFRPTWAAQLTAE